jgi:hypothetical protein
LSVFKEWEIFYLIVGAAAGALAGLQFVVLTLITESGVLRGSEETLAAFGSPNVVHFCAALLISALAGVPWRHLGPPALAFALCGAAGLVYSLRVWRRAREQRDYEPVLEDWTWHVVLPIVAYASLLVSGASLPKAPIEGLYGVGGASLLLVFIGVHNAWDTVSYVTVERTRAARNRTENPSDR